MAHLLLHYANSDYYTCGASLISPTTVLTAAHCLHDTPDNVLRDVTVRLGAPARALRARSARAARLLAYV
jgi:V8-like Glu-specific endopeptidase